MKTQLLALSLVTVSGLLAEDSPRYTAQASACSTCCCTPCCCKPQPTECVSGVAYTVPFYDLQCDWGISIDVEFLYWYARETDLSYALLVKVIDSGQTPNTRGMVMPHKYKELHSEWDPGFRVGLGWNMECDGWDLYLNYTWVRNKKKTSTSAPDFNLPIEIGQTALQNPWINQGLYAVFSFPGELLFQKVGAKWKLHWDVIDLELGRKYWLSSCFNLRPYGGLRGAWWKTKFSTLSVLSTLTAFGDPRNMQSKDRFTNHAWGIGIVGGLQPTWYFCCNFALYSNFDISLIWGDFRSRKKESFFADLTNTFTESTIIRADYSNRSTRKFEQMTPILDAAIGLRWEETWCCDRYRTILDLGWEHHIYFDQNHRIKPIGLDTTGGVLNVGTPFPNTQTYIPEAGNIGLGGFVLRGRFDF